MLNTDQDPVKFRHSVINGLSIWEDFNTSDGKQLKSSFRSETMTIFIITKGSGTVTINMEDTHLNENSLLHLSPNTLIDLPNENQIFTITGVSFTNDFLSDVGMPE